MMFVRIKGEEAKCINSILQTPILVATTANPALRIYNSVTQSQDDACRVKTLFINRIKEAS